MRRESLKPIYLSSETTASIHRNVSEGYYEILDSGLKIFIPYTKNEFGEIHEFISLQIQRYKHMKWTKTHEWKNQQKAKKSRWKYHPTFGGLNTVTR